LVPGLPANQNKIMAATCTLAGVTDGSGCFSVQALGGENKQKLLLLYALAALNAANSLTDYTDVLSSTLITDANSAFCALPPEMYLQALIKIVADAAALSDNIDDKLAHVACLEGQPPALIDKLILYLICQFLAPR